MPGGGGAEAAKGVLADSALLLHRALDRVYAHPQELKPLDVLAARPADAALHRVCQQQRR